MQCSILRAIRRAPPTLVSPRERAMRQFGSVGGPKKMMQDFWNWTTQERPHWTKNAKESIIACTIFAFTGSFTLVAVRPALKTVVGVEGTLWDGPNEYRVLSILCISPVYSLVLLMTGTLLGRHRFFANMSMKIWGRMLPKSVTNSLLCRPARVKRGV